MNNKISKNSIRRLIRYRTVLQRFQNMGLGKVFSDNLAEALDIKASQVRKDFSLFNLTGNKRGGYVIGDLLEKITNIIGKNRTYNTIIIGAGNLGKALLQYTGFEKEDIKIKAAFDIDPAETHKQYSTPVLPMENLHSFIQENDIEIAILTTPALAAQRVMDLLVKANIKGVLNFAPIRLKAPKEIFINNVNLLQELENIIFFIKEKKEKIAVI
ncbi:MAG: redox-sensing transcriptional repressor Rex [Spirochaetales bacterium]|nr:redox-sensing transcriptional repressor Rex [Spirochaetales bacterium]